MSAGAEQHNAPVGYSEIRSTEQMRLFTILLDEDDGDENDKDEDDGDDVDSYDTFDGKHRLRIQLHVYEIGSEPAYEALSYTCGDPEKREMIICNGQPLEVTRNCFEALQALRVRQRRKIHRLRSPGPHRKDEVPPWIRKRQRSRSVIAPDYNVAHLWIDAVCINQGDRAERSGQVRIMGSIFQNAFCTIVYLGRMDKSARSILAHVEHLDLSSLDSLYAEEYLRQLPLSAESGFASDWETLYSRAWFTRAWVVQEALLSTQLTVLVGNNEYYWDSLALAGRVWRDFESMNRAGWHVQDHPGVVQGLPSINTSMHVVFSKDFDYEASTFLNLDENSSYGHRNSGIPRDPSIERHCTYDCATQHGMQVATLCVPKHDHFGAVAEAAKVFDLLCITMGLQCQDPRDRLFALRSLLSTTSAELVVDYDKSASEVFVDVSWYLISHGVLASLSLAGLCRRPARIDLPSWVVDWTEDLTVTRKELTWPSALAMDGFGLPQTCYGWGKDFEIQMKRMGDSIAIPGYMLDAHVTDTGQGTFSVEGVASKTFRTADGGCGECFMTPQDGDRLCLFRGCNVHFMLRASGLAWRLLGQCHYSFYVQTTTTSPKHMGQAEILFGADRSHDIWLV